MSMPKSARCRARAAGVAATAVTMAGLLNSSATQASLVVDIRALAAPGGTIDGAGKTVIYVPTSQSTTVTLGVFARVTGTNSFTEVGDFDGQGDGPDTRTDEGLQIVTGSFTSGRAGSGFQSGLLGSFILPPGGQGDPINYETRVGPFTAPGSSAGFANDLDGDGDFDIGSTGTSSALMWNPRSFSGAFLYDEDGQTFSSPTGNGTANGASFNATSSEFRIGTLRWVIGHPSYQQGVANIHFIPRPDTTGGTALWMEDGVLRTPASGSFASSGLDVRIWSVTPGGNPPRALQPRPLRPRGPRRVATPPPRQRRRPVKVRRPTRVGANSYYSGRRS